MKNFDKQKRSLLVQGLMEELKRVSWPTKKQTINLTFVVIGISLIIGVYIGIIDILLTKALELLSQVR